MTRIGVICWAVALLAVGCSKTKGDGGDFKCSDTDRRCPAGFVCDGTWCVEAPPADSGARADGEARRDTGGPRSDGAGDAAGDGSGPGRDGSGPGRDGSGPRRDGSGDGAGTGRDGAGTGRDGAGTGRDGAGTGRDGAGTGRDGTGGSPPDGRGPDIAPARALVDDTHAHFRAGTLPESGARLAPTASGRLELIHGRDLDGDGFLDVTLASFGRGTRRAVNSYVYWGSRGGLSPRNRTALPTLGAYASTAADLDGDGRLDLVFANFGSASTGRVNSYIYWGRPGGFQASSRGGLPTDGASGVAVADLDRDGWLDLVFTNSSGATRGLNAYVYFGAKTGFSPTRRTELPAVNGTAPLIADLDRDGRLDLVICNQRSGTKHAVNSYVYWGRATGFSATTRAELPTVGAAGVAAADLDGDGHLDLVFANESDGKTTRINSYVYWGAAAGFSSTRRAEIPGLGARGVAVADLDRDRKLDIVLANSHDGKGPKVNAYIYWGAGTRGYTVSSRTELPVLGAFGVQVADLDADGQLDILFGNTDDGKSSAVNSYIYWGARSGPRGGYRASLRTELPAISARVRHLPAPGRVADRQPMHTFVSRPLDRGAGGLGYTTLSWRARVPSGARLTFQLRSASTRAGLARAVWYGPASPASLYTVSGMVVNRIHAGHRHIQYRAIFREGPAGAASLDAVVIGYR